MNGKFKIAAGCALGASALGFGALMGLIAGVGRRDEAALAQRHRVQAIVVLGARVNEAGQAGDSLRTRTLHAVALYQCGIAPVLIFSGGVGDNPPAEAQVAATLAQSQKVPRSALLLEAHSTSTRENARFTAQLCRRHGWKRVLIVSDGYHLLRARREFSRAGLEPFTSPSNGSRTSQSIWWRTAMTAREAVLLLRDLMRGDSDFSSSA